MTRRIGFALVCLATQVVLILTGRYEQAAAYGAALLVILSREEQR